MNKKLSNLSCGQKRQTQDSESHTQTFKPSKKKETTAAAQVFFVPWW